MEEEYALEVRIFCCSWCLDARKSPSEKYTNVSLCQFHDFGFIERQRGIATGFARARELAVSPLPDRVSRA